eukprot:6491643-Amphidinium_carterae.2
MLALCIGYDDGSFKVPKQFHGKYGKQWRLNRPGWLTSELQRCGAPESLQVPIRVQKREVSAKTPGTLLVKVEPGSIYTGPLTAWSQQEFFYFNYLLRPVDAFSLRVRAGVIIEPAIDINVAAKQSVRSQSFVFASPSLIRFPSHMHCRFTDTASNSTLSFEQVADMLQITAEQWRSLHNDVICVWLPDPILYLMKKGAWNSLVLQARWLHGWRKQELRKMFNQRLT